MKCFLKFEEQIKKHGKCHTCFSKETKCITICMSGSSFIHIVTYKWIQKQYHVKKEKDYQSITLDAGNEGFKYHRQSTRGCVRLAPATSSQQLHGSFLFLRNIVYSKGEHMSYSASVGKVWMQSLKQGKANRLTALSNFSWSNFFSTWLLIKYKYIPSHIKHKGKRYTIRLWQA
jgi:hypothetical protein